MTTVSSAGSAAVNPCYAHWGSQGAREEGREDGGGQLTPLERLTRQLSHDEQTIQEVTLGKRVGFYRLRGQIGTGNFSQVKLAIHSLTREKVAIKILDKTKLDQKTQRLLSREIASMERLHHPNIIRLYEVIETLSKLHLVMEYAGGGELYTRITNEGRLPEVAGKATFAQILSAVKHMHENGTIHRDLKAENIFYADNARVKVGDFGFSTASRLDESLSTFCGSPPYAAPELFRDESYVGACVDIWALGVLLYFIVAGAMPFRADTVAKLKRCILDGTYPEPAHISEPCLRLIRGILRPAASERLSLAQILRSEWMKGVRVPRPHEPFPLDPGHLSSAGQPLRKEQAEVKGVMARLGVTERHILEDRGKGARSRVTGIYRIVLHRVQKRQDPDLDPPAPLILPKPGDARKEHPKLSRQAGQTSKFCSIL
ncbi:serine/threonine-protein kinase NIM1-like [Narcine bancroftii]|uniref:serine/threonine-protein kinase NIM1-like n=1 Tax=Narcine bancroftii TaxID=1343680 RepID=UPI003831B492